MSSDAVTSPPNLPTALLLFSWVMTFVTSLNVVVLFQSSVTQTQSFTPPFQSLELLSPAPFKRLLKCCFRLSINSLSHQSVKARGRSPSMNVLKFWKILSSTAYPPFPRNALHPDSMFLLVFVSFHILPGSMLYQYHQHYVLLQIRWRGVVKLYVPSIQFHDDLVVNDWFHFALLCAQLELKTVKYRP